MAQPSHGFRHAATLLIAARLRALAPGASSDAAARVLEALARDLAGLAGDMRAGPAAAGWLREEFARAIAGLPHAFDRTGAQGMADAVFAALGASAPRAIEPRDVFLVYAPEDRLPLAGPLAVDLAKRRMTVAFADYEVADAAGLAAALDQGLTHHRCGLILHTDAFDRRGLATGLTESGRLRVVRAADPDVADIAAWVASQKLGPGSGAHRP